MVQPNHHPKLGLIFDSMSQIQEVTIDLPIKGSVDLDYAKIVF